MQILILSNEVWNDKINGNNVTSNWFEGFDGDFANIYLSSGSPYNKCCNKYFQVTDKMMLKSFLGEKAGIEVKIKENDVYDVQQTKKKAFNFLKKFACSFTRLLRQFLWLTGRYNKKAIKEFIDDFKPDIIFSERMASPKILRFERIVRKISNTPMIAFTGDDEYSLQQLSFSPSFWISRFITRRMLRKNVKMYNIYYTLSYEQALYYEKEFGCKCKLLQKCGQIKDVAINENINEPIRLIYAGKFYCKRWKALSDIVSVLKEINRDGPKAVLEIYTKDIPTKKQNKLLNDGKNSLIMGAVNQEKLKEVYKKADISIHVESLSLKYRLATRYSFSTKIIDCIFSGTALLAYCPKEHSGLTYLEREDAAFCVCDYETLKRTLFNIINNPNLIIEYKKKALDCGIKNNNKFIVQKMIEKDFNEVINESSSN